MKRFSVLSVLLLIAVEVSALSVMEINTEFLWDNSLPHEGQLVGTKIDAPTLAQYESEVSYFASLIEENKADIVTLVEIEGCHVAGHLRDVLNTHRAGWNLACKKGRDSYTGQDVAILTRLEIRENTISSLDDFYSMLGSKRIRPSKVLSVIAVDAESNESYLLIAAHLVSKRSNNDAKRNAQAKAINSARLFMVEAHSPTHTIVMGDLNDVDGSDTLETLKSEVLVSPAGTEDCSYTYQNKCNLIDHILVTETLGGGDFSTIDVPDSFSDHKTIIYSF